MKKKSSILFFLFFLFIFSANAQTNKQDEPQNLSQNNESQFLLPINIYRNIISRTSKEKIIKDLNLNLITHRGGVDYYEIGETLAGLRFVGQYLTEISFRYFGEEGLNYETSIVKAGFLLKKRAKSSNLEIDPGFEVQTLDGEIRVYKKGNIVCRVYDGTYLGFSFSKAHT